jgi:hypothetical protein
MILALERFGELHVEIKIARRACAAACRAAPTSARSIGAGA